MKSFRRQDIVMVPSQAIWFHELLMAAWLRLPDGQLSALFSSMDWRVPEGGRASGARKADWQRRIVQMSGVAYAILALGSDISARVIKRWCESRGYICPKSDRCIWKLRKALPRWELEIASEDASLMRFLSDARRNEILQRQQTLN
jgi:hypothetical protein